MDKYDLLPEASPRICGHVVGASVSRGSSTRKPQLDVRRPDEPRAHRRVRRAVRRAARPRAMFIHVYSNSELERIFSIVLKFVLNVLNIIFLKKSKYLLRNFRKFENLL